MKTTQTIFLAPIAGLTLLLSGCTGDVWVSAPYEGGDYGPFYGYHHFYGRRFENRHFVTGHGGEYHGGGYHSGGSHQGSGGHSGGGHR